MYTMVRLFEMTNFNYLAKDFVCLNIQNCNFKQRIIL